MTIGTTYLVREKKRERRRERNGKTKREEEKLRERVNKMALKTVSRINKCSGEKSAYFSHCYSQ